MSGAGSTPAVQVRAATDDTDLETLASIIRTTTPDDPTSLEEMRWADEVYPGALRLLAEMDGRAVGAASVGRIWIYPPGYPDLWLTLVVLDGHRRRGVGSALLAAVADHARIEGKEGLQLRCREDRTEGIEFLRHRGFSEFERSRMVRLELTGRARPDARVPDGIRLATLAERPELVTGVHAVAQASFADIPGGDEMVVGDLAEFRARDVDRPGIPADGFWLALAAETDEVVGYASLLFLPGSTEVAWHDMTAVRREWRGRGVATALKEATITWAMDRGLRALETGNDEENAAMRSVNIRLGYAPLPDEVVMRGLIPAADGTGSEADSEGPTDAA